MGERRRKHRCTAKASEPRVKVKLLEMMPLFSFTFSRPTSGAHHDHICPRMLLFPRRSHAQSHTEAFRRNIGGVWTKADVFKFNKTWILLYKWSVSLYQHRKRIMGILRTESHIIWEVKQWWHTHFHKWAWMKGWNVCGMFYKTGSLNIVPARMTLCRMQNSKNASSHLQFNQA